MNKKKLITLMWFVLMTTTGILTPEKDRRAVENVMQSAGYPKPGDIPTLNRKIFKGYRVAIREHPYMASIRRSCSHYLTGVLATRSVVLTVAHPLVNVPVKELNVVIGENYNDRGTILYTVVLVIVHQDFDQYTLKNDIAMLRLYERITYKMNVKSILLVAQKEELEGKTAFVTGWGRCDNVGMELCLDRTSTYYPGERIDPMLRTVSFTISKPNYYCEGYRRHEVPLHPGMLCTGVAREQDQVAPCLAVPGAPLVVRAGLAGLLSWGFGCGYSYDMPLVYTDIPHFLPWITHNNKLLFKIKQNNLTVLFEATKAALLSQWLVEARNITPLYSILTERNVDPLPIDYHLINIQGRIYDVRDYILDGYFAKEKAMMYETLRKEAAAQTSTLVSRRMTSTPPMPFLSNDTRIEAGL